MSGQDTLEKLSNKMCDCIESNNFKNAAQIEPCYDDIFANNYDDICKYYMTAELTDSQIDEFGYKIAAKTLEICDYIKNTFPTGIVGEKRSKQAIIECADLKNGEFYYLTQKPGSKVLDTTFVTISGDSYLEKLRNRTTYSKLKINWKDDCSFELVFEESNDPFKKEMLKKGDIFIYEMVANEDESFFIEINWQGTIFQSQIFKIR
ncbi:MAG: hypothetical protein AAFP89_09855 [Bacteroidota bacterium]